MNARGYSLVEALVAVTTAGLLAGITYPRLADVQDRFAVRGAANAFVSAHSLARTTAVRQGRVAELHIDSDQARIWVEVDTTANGTGVTDTVGAVIRLSDERVGLYTDRTLLCFDGRGLPSLATGCAADGARVILARDGTADTIVATSLGKVLR